MGCNAAREADCRRIWKHHLTAFVDRVPGMEFLANEYTGKVDF